MSDTLLLELGNAQGLDATLQWQLEDLRHTFVDRTHQLVTSLLPLAEQTRQNWLACVKAVAAGEAERIQGLRGVLLASLQRRLESLRQALRFTEMAAALNGGVVPGSEQLPASIMELERLQREVFDKWQSVEDLKRLAVAWYPLPQSRLRAHAATHPPPASWYEEEDMTFESEGME